MCGHAKEATTKASSLTSVGAAQLFNRLYIQNGLSHAPRIFTIRLSAPNTTRYSSYHFWVNFPLLVCDGEKTMKAENNLTKISMEERVIYNMWKELSGGVVTEKSCE